MATAEHDPEITLSLASDGVPFQVCRLSEFLEDNSEGLSERERRAIVATIGVGGIYAMGGGAAPELLLRRAAR